MRQELASVGKQTNSVHRLRIIIVAPRPISWETMGKSLYLTRPHSLKCERVTLLKVLCSNFAGWLRKSNELIDVKCVLVRVLHKTEPIGCVYTKRDLF